MCQAQERKPGFDPALCPLLAGLSPADIAERMAHDPLIRSCMASGHMPHRCTSSPEAATQAGRDGRKAVRKPVSAE